MAKRRKEENVHVAHDGDITVTPGGHKVLGINWYIRHAKAAMEERDWATAWYHLGSALARADDPAEIWDLRQLQKKAYKLLLNRKPPKGERKKELDKRKKRREYT